jgi:hypothetical protein
MKQDKVWTMRDLSAPMLSVALFALITGCSEAGEMWAAEPEQSVIATPAAMSDQTPARATKSTESAPAEFPSASFKPAIIASRDEMFRGAPSCIYTISPQERTDHEVRWTGNRCSDLAASFMSISDLEKYQKLDEMNEAERSSLAKEHPQGVFYVEGEFTASIYPQDPLGLPHEISVAD